PFGSFDLKKSPSADAADDATVEAAEEAVFAAFCIASPIGALARLKNHNAPSSTAASSTTGHSQRLVEAAAAGTAAAAAETLGSPPSRLRKPAGRKPDSRGASLCSVEARPVALTLLSRTNLLRPPSTSGAAIES